MIKIYADGVLTYDSRLEEYDLVGLNIKTVLGKGGTAKIVMPAEHPAYSKYKEFRTIVEIYRDDDLLFRGRALYPEDDANNVRTVMCEGELCLLQDGVSRPYSYESTPAATVFLAAVKEYNDQVDEFKRFKLGTVDAAFVENNINLESEDAETVLDTVNKLTELCGGYIVFTTDQSGERVINWTTSVGHDCTQTIEAGENLFDFSRSGANTDIATVLIPYGAKNEKTGKRVTIEDVNDEVDYIKDDEAVTLRGSIVKAVTWDDITDPQTLLDTARQYLDEHKLLVTSLTLTALDLSYIDKSLESFKLGDMIRVISRAHGVDQYFQLVEKDEDLLNPARSLINMGKEVRTLTSLDVAGDSKGQRLIQKAVQTVKNEAVQKAEQIAGDKIEGVVSKVEQVVANLETSFYDLRENFVRLRITNESFNADLSYLQLRSAYILLRFLSYTPVDEDNFLEVFKSKRNFYSFTGNLYLGGGGNEMLHVEMGYIRYIKDYPAPNNATKEALILWTPNQGAFVIQTPTADQYKYEVENVASQNLVC